MKRDQVTVALVGSGGAGVMTAGQMLLDAAAKVGWYGLMSRSSGPQIRGGEAAAFVRLSPNPVLAPGDVFDLVVAFDWQNVERFAAELPMTAASIIITDPEQGEVPPVLTASGARVLDVSIRELAGTVPGGRVNMVGLGVVAALVGLPRAGLDAVIRDALGKKGDAAVTASAAAIDAGATAVEGWGLGLTLPPPEPDGGARWNISGNEAAGFGALKAGVRFCAAYPITPATEILEWLAPNLARTGGLLVQAEDELASINMCLGASFGGVPSITATAGPGLSLMTEALGLAVASETPVVVVDVMRGGPSTGIPTKSEQSDLNIAVYGLHGDAPHLVLAPNSIGDCLFTTQWAVHLAEALQTPAIVLSDQAMGQSRAVIARPADAPHRAERRLADTQAGDYRRYAVTDDGVSPAAIPGMIGGEHTADGLEHSERGLPSSQAADHHRQLDKRQRKLTLHDYGPAWADVEGEGPVAILTWGSSAGPAREAAARLRAAGHAVRLVAVRLLSPVQPAAMAAALAGVDRVLVVEQTHGAQFHKYLRAHYDLPRGVAVMSRPGPLPIRAHEVEAALKPLLSESLIAVGSL
ncbi:2-oxoglutarate ferredoxin oxidoreductase subunit alpha [Azospirillum fermentarium]|uniref:2-oxoacid:acceptor oxidoreductase subunit alpha n=1 Tax=Azospirillum fermentarium TaxID=1233114 RepID=UPI0022268F93|nr:2-oxoacid:acceptor oxidoreductase subunit alpha [Azospirillum fermentarium]MCW2244487.1 2-oxoglutarate ferredoxin oxidoreductase subunit alpha [Azospirillum fermentarium]